MSDMQLCWAFKKKEGNGHTCIKFVDREPHKEPHVCCCGISWEGNP